MSDFGSIRVALNKLTEQMLSKSLVDHHYEEFLVNCNFVW